MWTLECFERVFAACAEHDTELFTYSASTAVRTAMLAAGFVVARGARDRQAPRDHARHDAGRRAALPSARGRVVLGPEWLEQWRRSDAKFPSDVPSAGHAALAERIEGLAQFRS